MLFKLQWQIELDKSGIYYNLSAKEDNSLIKHDNSC